MSKPFGMPNMYHSACKMSHSTCKTGHLARKTTHSVYNTKDSEEVKKTPKNRKEAGGSVNRYYVRSKPFISGFQSWKQFETDPIAIVFTAGEDFEFFRFSREIPSVGKSRH